MPAEPSRLVAALLAELPSGTLLDALVERYKPAPGMVKAQVSHMTLQRVTMPRNLYSTRLEASTTSDLVRIKEFMNANPATVRALACNRNLTPVDAQALVSRAETRSDGALAMSLVRSRPDIGILCAGDSTLFSLFSLRGDHDAVGAISATVSRMSLREVQAFDVLKGGKFDALKASAYARVIGMLRDGEAAVPVEVLAFIYPKVDRLYGGRFEMTRGLADLLPNASSDVKTALERVTSRVNPSYMGVGRNFSRSVEHACSDSGVLALARAGGVLDPELPQWDAWGDAFKSFGNLPQEEQLAALLRSQNIRGEALYHYRELRQWLAGVKAADVPSWLLEMVVEHPDCQNLLHANLCSGMFSGREDAGAFVKKLMRELPDSLPNVALLLEVFLLDPDYTSDATHIMNRIPTRELDSIPELMTDGQARVEYQTRVLHFPVTDPFALGTSRSMLGSASLSRYPLMSWCAPAYDWAIMRLIGSQPSLAMIDNFTTLSREWDGTFDELLEACYSL